MRIGLNATCLNDRPSGARQRFVGIYGEVIRQNPDTEFVIYEPSDCARKLAKGLGYWKTALRNDRLDLFEMFNLPMVRAPDCPTILTVHDTRQVRSEVAPIPRALYRLAWRRTLAGADHVITVSDTIRTEVLSLQPRARATTIYNGIPETTVARLDEAPSGGSRSEGYLLSVGHLEPRKNYGVLIRAVALLRDRGIRKELVIVGNDGGSRTEIAALVASLGLGDAVRLRQDVPTADLRDLYERCEAVVFPSRYEGFGIPVLEAMGAGKPLILSDISVFREITEDRGAYFAATDAAALASLIGTVAEDDALRDRLVAYGRARVRDFTFPALAAQVTKLHRSLV